MCPWLRCRLSRIVRAGWKAPERSLYSDTFSPGTPKAVVHGHFLNAQPAPAVRIMTESFTVALKREIIVQCVISELSRGFCHLF